MSVRNELGSVGTDGFTVERPVAVSDRHVEGLADVLIDCVDGGASVSFMHPLPLTKALEFWRGVADGVAHGARAPPGSGRRLAASGRGCRARMWKVVVGVGYGERRCRALVREAGLAAVR